MKRASLTLIPNLHEKKHMRVVAGLRGRKKRFIIFFFVSLFSLLLWQCSKNMQTNSTNDLSLKESLSANAQNLNKAVNDIAQTRGYQILSLNAGAQVKAATVQAIQYQDSITLASIAGVYEYKPTVINTWCYNCLNKLFVKTDSSNQFIVKLPQEKVFHPLNLRLHFQADTSLKNNFVITATDYHYYFTHGFLYDYRLSAGFAINDTSIGGLDVLSARNSQSNYSYRSDYTFPNGYDISVKIKSGDTISSDLTFSNGSGILLAETTNRYKTTGSWYRERQYILSVGNVKFIRSSANDSTQVYLNNVLQKNAKVEIIDTADSTSSSGSICHNRDVKITFDDGTSITLSTLLSPSLTALRSLVASLEDIYFATNIVDYIAWNIHQNKIQ